MTFRLKGAIFGTTAPAEPLDVLFGDDLDWITREASCLYVDDDERDRLFFPSSGSIDRRAYEICNDCPLLDACRAYAVARKGVMGVWGATSEAQREAIRQGEQPKMRLFADCGSRSGAAAHRTRGEKACEDCLVAERAYTAQRRASARERAA